MDQGLELSRLHRLHKHFINLGIQFWSIATHDFFSCSRQSHTLNVPKQSRSWRTIAMDEWQKAPGLRYGFEQQKFFYTVWYRIYIYIMNIYIYIIYTYIRTYTYRYKYIYRVTAKYPLPSARTFFRSHHSGLKFMQWCFFCSGVAPGFWLLFWACEAFCHTSWPSTSALHSTGIYCEILGIDLREREGVSRKTYLYFCIASLCKLGGGFPSMSTFACDGNSNVYKFTLKKTNIDVQNQPC